jgi:hypothetical protein
MAQKSAEYWRVEKLHKHTKSFAVIALILLTSMILIASVKAAGQASVTMVVSIGGTTDPAAPGTYTYADGTAVTLTATAGDGFVFQNWIISTSTGTVTDTDNPSEVTVSGGETYGIEAVFAPIQALPGLTVPPDMTTAAIVVVLAGAGGTTTPAPGTYALASAEQFDLKAIPNSGFQFVHWVITGTPMSHGAYSFTATPTDNPYNVNHGYGNTYTYQPVFIPVGSTEPTPSASPTPGPIGGLSMEWWIIIVLVVVIVIVLIAFGAYASMKRSKK